MTSLTRRFSSLVSGNPPSTVRSQRTAVDACAPDLSSSSESGRAPLAWVVISTTKTPPVAGWRATSPSEVEKVESSSWANCVFFPPRRMPG